MSDYKVRYATLEDAQAVAAIQATGGLSKPPAFWREAIEFAEPQVQVIFDGPTMVGMVGYDRSRDPGTKNTVGEIWAIYVLPSHQGTGAGLMLWDAAREGLVEEGCTQVTVWISLQNDKAMRFHELAGFKRELPTARTVSRVGKKIEEIRLKRALN